MKIPLVEVKFDSIDQIVEILKCKNVFVLEFMNTTTILKYVHNTLEHFGSYHHQSILKYSQTNNFYIAIINKKYNGRLIFILSKHEDSETNEISVVNLKPLPYNTRLRFYGNTVCSNDTIF
ncbi:hypothetical protein A3Q56_00779 [Intoshia linei]|uniref:Uncharacterized protein n=1 Tax=Intoshia linei TaxID=1819745 RepID=A0A177BB84_9BILA|nr:hypothetical protein A3Q56_00779 [Intoshia linei]